MTVKKTYVYLLTVICFAVMLSSCTQSKNFIFLEDIQPNITINLPDERPIKLQSGDKLNISVHSRDRELVEMFNLPSGSSYTVDETGKIEMPIIGSIHVKGLSRMEVQNIVRYKLLASKLVRDPVVMVQFLDLAFYTIGQNSAKYPIQADKLTILEAVSQIGGVPLTSRFDNVTVLRRIDGQQTPYVVNLTNTDDVYSSPVYYIQQNDIIYIKPTDITLDQTSVFGSSYRNPTFWLSMFNTVLGLVLMFTSFK